MEVLDRLVMAAILATKPGGTLTPPRFVVGRGRWLVESSEEVVRREEIEGGWDWIV